MQADSNELPLVGVIAKLQLEPGDILVVKSEKKLSSVQFSRLRDNVQSALDGVGLWPAVKVMILDDGLDLSVLRANGADGAGNNEG